MGKKYDLSIILPVLFLLSVGLVILKTIELTTKVPLSTGFSVQIIAVWLALFIGYLVYRYGYLLERISLIIYLISLILLVMVFFIGQTGGGALRWLQIGDVQLQPSELIKFTLLVIQAKLLSSKVDYLEKPWTLILSVIYVGIPVFLILLQPDVGTVIVITGAWLAQLLFSSLPKRTFVLILGLLLLVIPASYPFLADYQKDRINTFINPSIDTQAEGYNALQAQIAVGSGGILGKGLDSGTQSQLNFLPAQHTDFIYAVIGEKLGLVGSLCVILAFVFLLVRLTYASWFGQRDFTCLFGIGVVATIGIQFFINIGMNIGLVPVTGIPLPFISGGGSHIIVEIAMVGTLLGLIKNPN